MHLRRSRHRILDIGPMAISTRAPRIDGALWGMRELSPEDVERRRARVDLLEAVDAAMGQGTRFLELSQAAETVEDFRSAIQDWLGCSPKSARAVMELQMRRMPRAERQKITDELHQVRRELAEQADN